MLIEIVYGLLAVAALMIGLGIIWIIHYREEFHKVEKAIVERTKENIHLQSVVEAAEALADHRKMVNDKILDIVTNHPDVPKPVQVAVIAVTK